MRVINRLYLIPELIRNKFVKHRIPGFNEINGWLTEREAVALFLLAGKLADKSTAVEIGSWEGRSTYCLAKGLRSGCVVSIDPFDTRDDKHQKMPLLKQFQANMSHFGVARKIKTLQGYSSDFVDEVGKIDLLFIDGDHRFESCAFDYNNYAPKIKEGGYLVFHDYLPMVKNSGVAKVVDQLVDRKKYPHFRIYDSLWVAKKVNSHETKK